jgi:hypothetical protein
MVSPTCPGRPTASAAKPQRARCDDWRLAAQPQTRRTDEVGPWVAFVDASRSGFAWAARRHTSGERDMFLGKVLQDKFRELGPGNLRCPISFKVGI